MRPKSRLQDAGMRYEKNGCNKMFPLLSLYERFLGVLVYEESRNLFMNNIGAHRKFMPIEEHRAVLELRSDSHVRIMENLLRHGFVYKTSWGGLCTTEKGVQLHDALEYVVGLLDDFVPASELEADE